MPNTNYGDRPVSADELVTAFGSAEAALHATGGENRLALYYLNNPDRVATAPKVSALETELTHELRAMRDVAREVEKNAKRVERHRARLAAAADAYAVRGKISDVMRAIRSSRSTAKRLVRLTQAKA